MTREEMYDTIPEYRNRVDHYGTKDIPEERAARGRGRLGAAGTDHGRYDSPPVELDFWFNAFPDQLDVVPA